MNYQQFTEAVKKETSALLGDTATIQIQTVLKNNGMKRTGLMISQIGVNISPTIYLEYFYTQFQNERPLSEIAQNIQTIYEEVKPEKSWDVHELQDFEIAKSKLACKLIGRSSNEELLSAIPHISYLDLEIVFYLLIEDCKQGVATILVTNDILSGWGISQEVLYQVATTNTPKLLEAECKPMREMIAELLGEKASDEEDCESFLYVLTNTLRHCGAACLLYPNVLSDIANQLDDDYYLLPSSIHELIIVPKKHALSSQELHEMVVEINTSQLLEEEVLSDHAYYYSRSEDIVVPM